MTKSKYAPIANGPDVRPPPSPGRREAGKTERRTRIVETARSLIREGGDTGLSMRMLAERAGVSPATPYNLFGSKRAILLAVLEDLRGFDKAFAVSSRLPPLLRMLRAAELAVSYYEGDAEFYRALWTSILRTGASEDRSAIFNPKRDAFWLGLLSEAREQGHLRPDTSLPMLLRALDYAFRGTVHHWALGELPDEALQTAVAYAYVLTLRGAATPAGLAELEEPLVRLQAPAHSDRLQRGP